MRRTLIACLAVAGLLAACGTGSTAPLGATKAQLAQADTYAIDQIEVTWHRASSTKNVDLMMSIWADDATFTVGTKTYTGKAEIRDFFAHKAGPFRPENHWVSDTPAYKVKITVDGDRGTLYFECHYIDAKTRQVKSVVAADQQVARIKGTWLITSSVSSSPELGAY